MTDHLAVLRHMLAITLRADRRRSILTAVLVAVQAMLIPVTAWSQRWLIDSAGLGALSGVLGAAALGTAAHGLTHAGGRVQHNIAGDLVHRVYMIVNQEILVTAASVPGIEHLERPDYLDRLTRLRRSAWALASACRSVAETVAAVVSLGLVLWLLASVHPVLVGAAVLAAPPLYLANRGRRLIQQVTDETAELERLETELHDLCINPSAGAEVRTSGSGEWLNDRAEQAWGSLNRRRDRARIHAAALQLAGWASYALGFIAALAVVVQLVIDQRATLGDIVMVITLASQLRGNIQWTVNGIVSLGEAGHVIGHYRWLLDYADGQRSTGSAVPPRQLQDGITLRDVSFAYPGTEREVLTGVDLHLPAGHSIAVVGINGAGKTTLVKLLAGLYEPSGGSIEIDGVPLESLDPVAWRERLTGTFQDFMKFEFLARETVGVGDLPSVEDQAAVGRAVAAGGASPVVDALDDGLETQLGRVFDGVELSRGQWQRLALARGHMRTDPLLLVLDEPTAALDPQAEHDLYERFVEQTSATARQSGSVSLLVSHRFSTVRMADLIVVLDEGRITEVGTHDQLTAAGGTYAEQYRIQASGYAD